MTIKTLNIEELVKKKYITPSIDVCGLMEGNNILVASVEGNVDDMEQGEEGVGNESKQRFYHNSYSGFYE